MVHPTPFNDGMDHSILIYAGMVWDNLFCDGMGWDVIFGWAVIDNPSPCHYAMLHPTPFNNGMDHCILIYAGMVWDNLFCAGMG